MSINLPKPIANYFAADLGGSAATAVCFTENAVVKAEGFVMHLSWIGI